MSAAKNAEALLARLGSDTPDLDAIVAAVVIVAVALRRRPRRDSPRATIARRDGRRLTAFPQYLVHETASDVWVALDVEAHPPVLKVTWNATGSIVVDEIDPGDRDSDAAFDWSWREVADGLASALRALPPSARKPKPTRCPNCRKEFYQ